MAIVWHFSVALIRGRGYESRKPQCACRRKGPPPCRLMCVMTGAAGAQCVVLYLTMAWPPVHTAMGWCVRSTGCEALNSPSPPGVVAVLPVPLAASCVPATLALSS